jgi:O-antigen ligase
MTTAAGTRAAWSARLTAALPLAMFAGLAIAGGVATTALLARPLAAAAGLGATAAVVAAVAVARRFGAAAVWVGAALVAIMAGEMSSVSAGGQSGRLLWADLVVGLGAGVACVRGSFVIQVPRAPLLDRLWPFLGWCALGLLVAADPLTAVAELKEWVVTALLAVGAVTAASDARRARLLLVAVAFTGVLVAGGMLGVAATSSMGAPLAIMRKLVDLPWGRTNYLAGLLLLAIPLLLGLLGAAAGLGARLACAAGLIVTMGGLLVSASKGAILSLALALGLSFGVARHQMRAPRLLVLLMFAAGAAVCVAGPLRQVIELRLQESALDYSVGERMDLYHLAWEQFLRHPVCGLGLNMFSVVAHRLHGVDTVPHNFELGFLAELGLPGTLLALAWAWGLGAGARRARRWAVGPRERSLALGLWAAFLAFAFHNQVESTLYGQQYKMLLVVFAAAAWAIGREWQQRAHVASART